MQDRGRVIVKSLVLSFFLLLGATGARAQSLNTYKVDSDHVYIAGISSGATMAMQMSVAYSRVFKGAALYAGQPYYCIRGEPMIYLGSCSSNFPPVDEKGLEKIATSFAAQGEIDPTDNLTGQAIYLWSGKLDTLIVTGVTNAADRFYKDFGATVFHYDNDFLAVHGWESPYGPLPCARFDTPCIIKCDRTGKTYDSEEVWLTKWFGPLQPKNNGALQGSMYVFDQNPYVPGGVANKVSMDNYGYVFVPRSCGAGTSCGLIVALHGCVQNASQIGLQFVYNSGLNQWADNNNIIVVYPQTAPPSLVNPNAGCWDIFGYLPEGDANYAKKKGPQMQALFNIVKQLAGNAVPAGG
jgi:dienelactone hydrolase